VRHASSRKGRAGPGSNPVHPPHHRWRRYIKDWVTAKIRWGLDQDSAEKAALQDVAAGCTNSTITVTVAS
jgi:hypothetical protein